MACEKHGQTNPTMCKYCDAEAFEKEEQRMKAERIKHTEPTDEYLAGLDMNTPQGVAWHIVTTMIERPDGKFVDGHGWYESCAIRIADHIRAMS